jgi:hypothetical protein
MRINFEDGSFIALMPDGDKVTFVTCGRKNRNETVMSSSDITREQAETLANFLTEWLKSAPVGVI